jgi:hypothetical protein
MEWHSSGGGEEWVLLGGKYDNIKMNLKEIG